MPSSSTMRGSSRSAIAWRSYRSQSFHSGFHFHLTVRQVSRGHLADTDSHSDDLIVGIRRPSQLRFPSRSPGVSLTGGTSKPRRGGAFRENLCMFPTNDSAPPHRAQAVRHLSAPRLWGWRQSPRRRGNKPRPARPFSSAHRVPAPSRNDLAPRGDARSAREPPAQSGDPTCHSATESLRHAQGRAGRRRDR